MKRILGAAMAASISVGAISGCGGPEVIEQPAAIEGFAYGVNSQLWDKKWTQYTEQDYIPSGEVRNVRHREVFDRCIAVDDEIFSFNADDRECFFDFSFDACSPEEYEHCEAVYEDRWDFEQLEDYIVQQCTATLSKMEYKPKEPKTNELCDKSRKGAQWVTREEVFVVWLRTPNPKASDENPEEPKTLIDSEYVSASEWSVAERGARVAAVITDGEITDVKFG